MTRSVKRFSALISLLLSLLLLTSCLGDLKATSAPATTPPITTPTVTTPTATLPPTLSLPPVTAPSGETLPAFSGAPYVPVNGNQPLFTDTELAAALTSYEYFSPLDALGRCGVVHASINVELMPTEDREEIGSVTPSGWKGNNNRYDTDIVSGGYIYNRSHLIGFQLTGENDNELNLITGTRFFNVDGMLPFENMVAAYVKEEVENHVLYRVTPIYYENDLVARGVLMEAYSVEDEGDGICFCVFVFNNQPGVTLDYATGANWLSGEPPVTTAPPATTSPSEAVYILNTKSKKFHDPDCSGAASISEANRQEYTGDRAYLIEAGYSPCGTCDP